MLSRSKKQAHKKTEPSLEGTSLAHPEPAAFGSTPVKQDVTRLSEPELWWSNHYHWLKENGYVLRPRYAPDWTPSWRGTKKSWFECEDGHVAMYPSRILDGTRASDGAFIVLKLVDQSLHPYEIDIARYFSSQMLATSANHCVPVYDVLSVPDENKAIIVMPLLQEYTYPPFVTLGEAVECMKQLFEGLHFMHKHRVAHRDCSGINIMMDPNRLYIDAFHPASTLLKRDLSGYARYKTRTERPPKYFFIDFGLSRRYDDSIVKPLEVPIWGADKEVPEFQNSNAPRDPFATDVFYIGNTIKEDFIQSYLGFDFIRPLIADMTQEDPSKRPTMDEVVQRFEAMRTGFTTWKLRSRLIFRGEGTYRGVLRGTLHWMRQIWLIVRAIPPVPASV